MGIQNTSGAEIEDLKKQLEEYEARIKKKDKEYNKMYEKFKELEKVADEKEKTIQLLQNQKMMSQVS